MLAWWLRGKKPIESSPGIIDCWVNLPSFWKRSDVDMPLGMAHIEEPEPHGHEYVWGPWQARKTCWTKGYFMGDDGLGFDRLGKCPCGEKTTETVRAEPRKRYQSWFTPIWEIPNAR